MYYGVQWWKKGSNAKWKPTGWVPEAASFPKNYDLCRPFFVFEIGNCFLRSTISGHFHGFQCFLAFPPRSLWLEQAIFLRERETPERWVTWALQASCVGLYHMVFNSIFKIHHQQLLMRVQKELFEVFSYKIRENEFINWNCFFFLKMDFFCFFDPLEN